LSKAVGNALADDGQGDMVNGALLLIYDVLISKEV
jgi:hypothetical protein